MLTGAGVLHRRHAWTCLRETYKVLFLFVVRQQAVVRGTTNSASSIAASRGLAELTQNVIRSSHGHSTPSLKFHASRSSRFLVILLTKKQRKKQRNKEIERKQ